MTVFPGRINQHHDVQGSLTVDQAKTLAEENTGTGTQMSTGSGDAITAPAGGYQTLTDAGAAWTDADVGRYITIAGSSGGLNDGTFIVSAMGGGGTTLTYQAAGTGAAEPAYAGTWTVRDPYCLEDDLNFERTDRKLIKGTANYYSDVPTYQRPSAIGTNVPKNLTNLLSIDGYTTVRNVRQAAVKVRPNVSIAGDGNLLVADETFTTDTFNFNADDLNSFIEISNSTDADGIYRIKAVTDGQTLELDGLASATAEACDWELLSDRKGILSSRSYADAVDRRGIPIADTGAYDETRYDATYTEVIDPVHSAGITENDETVIWARSYGDELDPNETATDEGTRFFVQFKTGVNDVTATTAELESLAGRSGSAAAMAGGNKVITGLTGMTAEDVGRYISLYGCTADNAGHYKITVVTSATQVTVERTGNFTADSGVDWKISKHPGTFDFYNGDRYQNDALSETWGRTLLSSGVEASAPLAQEIADLREFSGADLAQTAPALTNTGNYYVWSELPDPANSNVEECLNELNEQVGSRDFTGILAAYDGSDLTTILQALADAIAGTSITRYIQRLAAAVPKGTAHNLLAPYTTDGTNNGLNLWVFWRKQLRDPGPVINGNDYEETSGSGGPGGVGQITPYERIEAGDHVNSFILQ